MTPIADMVERMFEAGSSVEIILLAIRTAETVTLRERDASRFVTIPSRSKAALRAERYRLNLKQKQLAAGANDAAATDFLEVKTERDANVTTVTPHCDLTSLLPSLKGSTEEVSKRENARARGTRLEPGTPLSEADRAAAIELGASPDHVDPMWAEFLDYWVGIPGQRGMKLGQRGWSATWRNRVRQVLSRGKRNVQTTQHPAGLFGASKDRFRDAFAELKAFNAEQRSSRSDGTVVELLPAAGRERA